MTNTIAATDETTAVDAVFSADYFTARERFRQAAAGRWQCAAHAIEPASPEPRQALTIDVARRGAEQPRRVLIVSSGLHGVEGLFGSAVQVAALRGLFGSWEPPPQTAVVVVHALNPHGFAHLRRTDEQNIDLNRNFLRDGEAFSGCPDTYRRLNSFLNPERPPPRIDLFRWQALLCILRYGLPALKQAVAAGQYEFPRGLFFGGHGPSATFERFRQLWPGWTGTAEFVLHLDFHTGLGRSAEYKLLLDYPTGPGERAWLEEVFGKDVVENSGSRGVAYETRGGIGGWCRTAYRFGRYCYLCAEFGTHDPVTVLGALRAENRAHHCCAPQDARRIRAKGRLCEAFCPTAPIWRAQALARALQLLTQARSVLEAGPR